MPALLRITRPALSCLFTVKPKWATVFDIGACNKYATLRYLGAITVCAIDTARYCFDHHPLIARLTNKHTASVTDSYPTHQTELYARNITAMEPAADTEAMRDIFSQISTDSDMDAEVGGSEIDDSDDDTGDSGGNAVADRINPWRVIAADVNRKARKPYETVLAKYLNGKMALAKAKSKTYDKLHDCLLDAFQDAYLNKLQFQRAMDRDITSRKVLQTARRLRDREDFGFDESIRYAVKKRRFLLSAEMDKCFRGDKLLHSDVDVDLSADETDTSPEEAKEDTYDDSDDDDDDNNDDDDDDNDNESK